MDTVSEQIRLLLRKYQFENNLTIQNLADKIKYSYPSIHSFLKRKKSGTNQFLYYICKYLKSEGIEIPDGIEETLIKQ